MPVYRYRTMAPSGGAEQRGVIDADTPREARDRLRAQGGYVLELTPAEAQRQAEAAPRWQAPPSAARLSALAQLTRQLGVLIGAGVTVTDALGSLIEQADQPRLEGVLRGLRQRITEGASLAEAVGAYAGGRGDHGTFSPLYVNMVRAGEASGTLADALERLAEQLQSQARLQGRLTTALAYPAIMSLVGVAVVVFLMTYVVPRIAMVLQGQGKVLPWPTQLMLWLSATLQATWPGLLALALALPLGLVALRRRPAGARLIDGLALRLPVLGGLIRKSEVSRFARTLSALLASDVPATEALEVTATVMSNAVLSETVLNAQLRILEGADINTPLRESGAFPAGVCHMIAIGEQSGQLAELLERVADGYDEEVELATQRALALLEPLLIVAMAVVVGFIVLSIVLPILAASRAP